MSENPESKNTSPKIVIMPNDSYHVFGEVPLVHKTQVVSEYGEPLTWKKDKVYQIKKKEGVEWYSLCRCGQSKNKPFCDGTHREIGFDGTETASTLPVKTRYRQSLPGTGITVMKDTSLCTQAGFCGLRDASLSRLVAATGDTKVRSLVIAMVERCPSGSLSYRIDPDGEDIEPDLPAQISTTTEITSEGPIPGPLWVTGSIPIQRSDGEPFEARNRVTLCNCGQSHQKPLCDGTHREIGEQALRQQKAQGR